MRVILKESISGQGSAGQIIQVKRGFARNFLFPKQLALPVNAENLAWLEAEKVKLAQKEAEAIAQAKVLVDALKNVVLTFKATLKEDQSLYGSIGVSEIVAELKAQGFEIDRHMVTLPEGNIRALGEYAVKIQSHETVMTMCAVHVVLAEDA